MLKVLVTGEPLTLNKGCMGMVLGTYHGLKEKYGLNFQMTILSSKFFKTDKGMYEDYENIKVVPLPWGSEEFKKFDYIKEMKLLLTDYLNINNKMVDDFFRGFDIVVDLNGDSLTEDYGLRPLVRRLLPLNIAVKNNIPVFICAQTIGPFKSFLGRELAKKTLNKASLITAREDRTFEYCTGIGIENMVKAGDMALLQKPVKNKTVEDISNQIFSKEKKVIGISVSSLMNVWGEKEGTKSFIDCMTEIVEKLTVEYNYHILTLPHVIRPGQDDRVAAKQLFDGLSNKSKDMVTLLEEDLPSDKLKYIIGHCDMLVASRMHAAIAGLSQNIPTICIATGMKFDGLVGDRLQQKEYILDIKKLNYNSIVEETLKLVSSIENNSDVVKELLASKIEIETKRSMENINYISQLKRS